MSKFANLTLRILTTGNGRRDTLVRVPFSTPALTNASSPPASLNANSVGELGEIQLQAGNITVDLPTTFTSAYPVIYAIIVPPTNSTNMKWLKGNAGDVGISLIPNLPLVLAVGPNTSSFVIQSQVAELCDFWVL